MRTRVPDIPRAILSASFSPPQISSAEAIDRIAAFLGLGNVAALTGAGISVDSGIRAYRGRDGRYMNPNYKCLSVLTRFDIVLTNYHIGLFCATS